MTPGSYARGGAGLEMRYGFYPSLFGTALIVITPVGLCGLGFGEESERDSMLCDMQTRWPKAHFTEDVAGFEIDINPARVLLFAIARDTLEERDARTVRITNADSCQLLTSEGLVL